MLQKFDKMKFLRYHDNVLVMQKKKRKKPGIYL